MERNFVIFTKNIRKLCITFADDMKKLLVIINPVSGTTNKNGLEDVISRRLGDIYDLDIRYTTAKGDATRFSIEAVKEKYFGVIAAGGDGTVNETAKALKDTDVAFGILPVGSGNGLARHLSIPMDVKDALEIIAKENIENLDYCTVNGTPFFCTFGMGFDASVSWKFAQQKRRGLMTYLKSTIEEYLNYKTAEYVIEANGNTLTENAFCVACCNASQYGNNAYIAPGADMTDGLLDVTIIHAGSMLRTAVVGIDLMSGTIKNNILIESFKTNHLTIRRKESGPAHIDGEPLIMGEELDIFCHHGGLHTFIPTETEEFRPVITPLKSRWTEMITKLKRLFEEDLL